MAQRVSLDNVTPLQFERLVEILSQAVSERQVKLQLWIPSGVEILFDSEWMSSLLQENELPVDPCIQQLNNDIPIMISAALMGQRNRMVAYLAPITELTEPDFGPEDDLNIIETELLSRCSLLEDTVINRELRNRYAIKATAKNNILAGTEWEVVQRHSDSSRDSPVGLTYANLNLYIQKPFTRQTHSALESETITLVLTTEEIIDLKANLEEALNAIYFATDNEGDL